MQMTMAVDIDAPPERVWPYLVQPDKAMQRYTMLKTFEYTSDDKGPAATFYWEEEVRGKTVLGVGSSVTSGRGGRNGGELGSKVLLRLDRLHKRSGAVVALDSCTCAAEPGQMLGFLDPNGAGKTATMRAILRIVQPDDRTGGHPRGATPRGSLHSRS